MIVTTGSKPSAEMIAQAKSLADELGGRYVHRRAQTLRGIARGSGDDRLLVVTPEGLRYYEGEEPPLFFHPSMAFVRVKRLRRGERDPLVDVSGVRPGDAVLDCTAGLASDAIVFSYAAGAAGSVTAFESEPVLAAVVRDGLRRYATGLPDVDEALRRIRVETRRHEQALAELPDDSYDIVYFDPMFRSAIEESSAIGAFRGLANPDALTAGSVAHAVRVARRAVVLKEQWSSGEFDRLGFERQPSKKTTKIAYGVIRP